MPSSLAHGYQHAEPRGPALQQGLAGFCSLCHTSPAARLEEVLGLGRKGTSSTHTRPGPWLPRQSWELVEKTPGALEDRAQSHMCLCHVLACCRGFSRPKLEAHRCQPEGPASLRQPGADLGTGSFVGIILEVPSSFFQSAS